MPAIAKQCWLPAELWARVFKIFVSQYASARKHRDKAGLLLVCRSWHGIVEPILFHDIAPSLHEIPRVLQRFRARSSLGDSVKSVVLAVGVIANPLDLAVARPPELVAALLRYTPNVHSVSGLRDIHFDRTVIDALIHLRHLRDYKLQMEKPEKLLWVARLENLHTLTIEWSGPAYGCGHWRLDQESRVQLAALPGIMNSCLRRLTFVVWLFVDDMGAFFTFLSKCSFPNLEALVLRYETRYFDGLQAPSFALLSSFLVAHRHLTRLTFEDATANQLAYALPWEQQVHTNIRVLTLESLNFTDPRQPRLRLCADSPLRMLVLKFVDFTESYDEAFLREFWSDLPTLMHGTNIAPPRGVTLGTLDWDGAVAMLIKGDPCAIVQFARCIILASESMRKGIVLLDKHGRALHSRRC